jgi:hypothetical protein
MPVGQFMAHANSFAAGKIHCAASGAQIPIYPLRKIFLDFYFDIWYTE